MIQAVGSSECKLVPRVVPPPLLTRALLAWLESEVSLRFRLPDRRWLLSLVMMEMMRGSLASRSSNWVEALGLRWRGRPEEGGGSTVSCQVSCQSEHMC